MPEKQRLRMQNTKIWISLALFLLIAVLRNQIISLLQFVPGDVLI